MERRLTSRSRDRNAGAPCKDLVTKSTMARCSPRLRGFVDLGGKQRGCARGWAEVRALLVYIAGRVFHAREPSSFSFRGLSHLRFSPRPPGGAISGSIRLLVRPVARRLLETRARGSYHKALAITSRDARGRHGTVRRKLRAPCPACPRARRVFVAASTRAT